MKVFKPNLTYSVAIDIKVSNIHHTIQDHKLVFKKLSLTNIRFIDFIQLCNCDNFILQEGGRGELVALPNQGVGQGWTLFASPPPCSSPFNTGKGLFYFGYFSLST